MIETTRENAWQEGTGRNAFFIALSASQEKLRDQSPTQAFYCGMKRLQAAAEAGDIRDWQENLNEINLLTRDIGFESMKDLETRAQIKKLEMTLLLRAGNKALQEAELAQRQGPKQKIPGTLHSRESCMAKPRSLEGWGSNYMPSYSPRHPEA